VRSPIPAAPAHSAPARKAVRFDALDARLVASCSASLIDTRLVRAELARLRGPRPGTRVYSARAIRSTISR
jgi:hypothetical protein